VCATIYGPFLGLEPLTQPNQVCVLAPTGQQVMVVVPEGAPAGTQFQCQLAS